KDYLTKNDKMFAVTVVEANRQAEVTASIDKTLYQQVWALGNMGRMKKEFGERIRAGKREEANQILNEYREQLKEKSALAGVDLAAPAMRNEIASLEAEAKDAFEGSASDQAVKQKSLSKKSFASGLNAQRRFHKKDK